jgi:anti-sigma B factor antagonist
MIPGHRHEAATSRPLTSATLADMVEDMGTGGVDEPAVLRLVGDVDALTQADYRRVAGDIIATTSAKTLVVDMTEVETIDSSGLGLLVHLHNATLDRGLAMVLVNVPPRANALLKRTGLDRVFAVEGR